MNSSIRIVSALLLISSIISCKKNKDEANGSGSLRLSKIIQWNVATPSKGIITQEFIYDNQKRVVELATVTGDSVGGEIINSPYMNFKCFYNGSETNSYKTIGHMDYDPTVTEIFHTYSSSGEINQDSVSISANSTMIRKYNYYTDKIIVQSQIINGSNTTTTYDSLLVVDHNFKETYITPYPFPSMSAGYKMIYDNKVNPFSKLNIASLFTTSWHVGFAAVLPHGFSKNNITEFKHGSYNLGNFTQLGIVTFKYTYNDSDMPTECRLNVVDYKNNLNNNYSLKFEYID
jgi:hypothetical protein